MRKKTIFVINNKRINVCVKYNAMINIAFLPQGSLRFSHVIFVCVCVESVMYEYF